MIRHFTLTICLLLATFSAIEASAIDGIRIESPYQKVVVYVDGQQVCSATSSCFVANLRGSCRVEVYAAPLHGGDTRRGTLLYSERIQCSFNEVTDIFIPESGRPGNNWGTSGHHRPGRPGGRPEPVMSPPAFDKFMALMKKQNFDSDRKEVLEHALQTSYFSTDQCIRLMDIYSFDSEKKALMKKIYPKISDKPNFYYAIDKLTFSSDKKEINDFIKRYHEKNN